MPESRDRLPIPPLIVGTLADSGRSGGVQLLSAERALRLTPELAPDQGVAALALHPTLPVVYGLTMRPEGRLLIWQVEHDQFVPAGDVPSYGTVPCHLAIDPAGEFLIITNYGTGSLSVFRLDRAGRVGVPCWLHTLTGSGPHPSRQDHAYPHQVTFIAADRVLVTDLGSDTVVSFALDRVTGALTQLRRSPLPAGSGPRHLVLLPDKQVAISGELNNSVILGELDPDTGAVTVSAVAPSSWKTDVRNEVEESLAGDIASDGEVIYVANRGYDTIATLRVGDGRLTLIDEFRANGTRPLHLHLSDQLLLVACERSSSVTVSKRTPEGAIEYLYGIDVPRPAWLAPFPSLNRPDASTPRYDE